MSGPNIEYDRDYVAKLFPMGDPACLNEHFIAGFLAGK